MSLPSSMRAFHDHLFFSKLNYLSLVLTEKKQLADGCHNYYGDDIKARKQQNREYAKPMDVDSNMCSSIWKGNSVLNKQELLDNYNVFDSEDYPKFSSASILYRNKLLNMEPQLEVENMLSQLVFVHFKVRSAGVLI